LGNSASIRRPTIISTGPGGWFADRLGRHEFPVAQHRHPVGQKEDFLQSMRDINDPDPALAQQPHNPEQPLHVVLGQRRRRLVHNQDARVVRQRLGDLHPLPVTDRKRADQQVRIEVVDIEVGQQLQRPPSHLGPVDPAEPPLRRMPHEDVLGDGQLREQQQFLIDGRDPGRLRLLRRGEIGRLAVERHRAGIGPVHARHDLDQRRLAGAILAKQRMHFACLDVEADVRQRPHAGKRFADAGELKDSVHAASLARHRAKENPSAVGRWNGETDSSRRMHDNRPDRPDRITPALVPR
jgi:hypothetical protein